MENREGIVDVGAGADEVVVMEGDGKVDAGWTGVGGVSELVELGEDGTAEVVSAGFFWVLEEVVDTVGLVEPLPSRYLMSVFL